MSEDKKWHVGVEIPDNLYQLLNLSALSLDTSRSQIIRNALRRWTEENKMTVGGLVEEIISIYQDQWDKKKLDYPEDALQKHFTLFIGRCRTELNRKNIEQPVFDKIIGGIKR